MTVAEPKKTSPEDAPENAGEKAEGLAERAGRIVDELAKRGESRTKDIQKAARDIADRSARDRRDLMRLIQKEIKRQVESLGLARRTDVDKIDERVKELEGKKPASVKKKPAAKKKSSPKSGSKPGPKSGAKRKPAARKSGAPKSSSQRKPTT